MNREDLFEVKRKHPVATLFACFDEQLIKCAWHKKVAYRRLIRIFTCLFLLNLRFLKFLHNFLTYSGDPNSPVFECHLNTGQPDHLSTKQMDTILFSYVLVWYSNGWSSTKTLTLDLTFLWVVVQYRKVS